jgi:GNAT superfamily N-acetyltransferase
MAADVSGTAIVQVGRDRLDELAQLWLQLHHLQGGLSAPIAGVPLRGDDDTFELVRTLYGEWLAGDEGFAFVAECDGRTVGYIIGYVSQPSEIWDTGRIGHVDSFLVDPALRGRGIGRLLLHAAYEHLRRVGVGTVGLDVVATNEGARRFYEREGFVPATLHMYRALPPAASSEGDG